MKWEIVPRSERHRELQYDDEVIDKLIADETVRVTEGWNRRLYQKVADQLGYRLRTTTKKEGQVVIWFEKKIKNDPTPVTEIPTGEKVKV